MTLKEEESQFFQRFKTMVENFLPHLYWHYFHMEGEACEYEALREFLSVNGIQH